MDYNHDVNIQKNTYPKMVDLEIANSYNVNIGWNKVHQRQKVRISYTRLLKT